MLGGYIVKLRGDVILKGSGVVKTFWLLGKVGEPQLTDETTS